jgi:hypothetical protein
VELQFGGAIKAPGGKMLDLDQTISRGFLWAHYNMDTMELNAEEVYLGNYMPLFGIEC